MDPNKPVVPNQQSPSPAVPAQPQPIAPINNTLPAAPVVQAVQPAAPTPTPVSEPPVTAVATPTSPPPPPKRKIPLKLIVIIAVVLMLVFVGIIAASFIINQRPVERIETDGLVFAPEKTPSAGPKEHTVFEYPDFAGVEVGSNTVAFNKVDDSFRILYRGQIYHEQDTGSFLPRKVTPETADDYKWYGLLDSPNSLVTTGGIGDQLFSFKAPPTYRSFVFIMRWDKPTGEVYEMYRFHDNGITKLTEFTKTRTFYVPKLHEFSLGGNFISINIFSCPTCTEEEPEVLLYHIPSGEVKNIGRVSHFAWGQDDNAYEYREYRPGVEPNLVPLLKNEFFVESVDILNP